MGRAGKKNKKNNKNKGTQYAKHQQEWQSKNKGKGKGKKNKERYDETDYEFHDGMRHVKPYVFEYQTHAKERWYGMTVEEIFKKEFGGNSPEYFELAIKDGRITVDGNKVPGSKLLERGNCIMHKIHRHEPPVTDQPVTIAYEDDDVAIVSKPASIPVHPSGAYRYNSMIYILTRQFPDTTFSIVHRLDRLTSGLVMLAKTKDMARRLQGDIFNKTVRKQYLARVVGAFPEEGLLSDKAGGAAVGAAGGVSVSEEQKKHTGGEWKWEDVEEGDSKGRWLTVSAPLQCASHKDGVWECHPDGKSAGTVCSV
jgi:tRNA pseudouridine synthase 9